MRKISLSKAQKIDLEYLHDKTKDGRIRDRIKAVLLRSEDWSTPMIAQALRLHETSLNSTGRARILPTPSDFEDGVVYRRWNANHYDRYSEESLEEFKNGFPPVVRVNVNSLACIGNGNHRHPERYDVQVKVGKVCLNSS